MGFSEIKNCFSGRKMDALNYAHDQFPSLMLALLSAEHPDASQPKIIINR
jgi:hypothetical protein